MDESKEREILYKYKNPLDAIPKMGVFENDQNCFVVTTNDMTLFVNIKTGEEVDIAANEDVKNIQNIGLSGNNDEFFILANKQEGRLGYYLFSVEIERPNRIATYLIKWENKLDIANCDIQMLDKCMHDGKQHYSLVVSYKCIEINTFNVFVFDLQTKLIEFWHESFQLWESPVKGFLLPSHDFLIISKLGINVIAIGQKGERVINDQEGFKRMIHSLGSCNYLKIEPEQHILFACQYYDDRQICIQDQYDNQNQQTQFEDVYKIKIHEITLRELMLIQSLYSCKTASEVSQLVKMQPSPLIFFKVYLELHIKSMIPYLSFDARSLLHLL